MKKFKIVSRKDFESTKIKEKFDIVLKANGWEESENPEMVIFIGGDGTMLEAFNKYYKEEVSFVGIHTGTLGFYADWKREEADFLLDKILNEQYERVNYPLVEVEIVMNDGKTEKFVALNEVVIKSKTMSTFLLEVFINNQRFESFRGDGMIISTPSGSTAYNHSVSGSILHPSIEAIQISELAAINNIEFRTLNRSFVLPKHHKLELYPKNSDKDILFGVDGYEHTYSSIRKIKLNVSEKKVSFARYKHFPFWNRVKEKFIGE